MSDTLTKFIMVLSDGRTFADMNGCKIVEIPGDWDTANVEVALRDAVEIDGFRTVAFFADDILVGGASGIIRTVHHDDPEGVLVPVETVAIKFRDDEKWSLVSVVAA